MFEGALADAGRQIAKLREEYHIPEPQMAYSEWTGPRPQPPAPLPKRKILAGTPTRTAMQVAISLCLLVATLFVILSAKYDANSKHWAFATVGTILGFWLKG
jgi:hypothetical protein